MSYSISHLTLHIDREWDDSYETPSTDTNIHLTLPLLLLVESLKKCPHLNNIYFTDLIREFEEKWLTYELFSIKVYNRDLCI